MKILLEKEKATHSSILAWSIPWTEEPGRLQFMGSRRVGHDWVTDTSTRIKLEKQELLQEWLLLLISINALMHNDQLGKPMPFFFIPNSRPSWKWNKTSPSVNYENTSEEKARDEYGHSHDVACPLENEVSEWSEACSVRSESLGLVL